MLPIHHAGLCLALVSIIVVYGEAPQGPQTVNSMTTLVANWSVWRSAQPSRSSARDQVTANELRTKGYACVAAANVNETDADGHRESENAMVTSASCASWPKNLQNLHRHRADRHLRAPCGRDRTQSPHEQAEGLHHHPEESDT